MNRRSCPLRCKSGLSSQNPIEFAKDLNGNYRQCRRNASDHIKCCSRAALIVETFGIGEQIGIESDPDHSS